LPAYTNLRWESAPEGWELWAVKDVWPGGFDEVQMLAWVYRLHHKNKWAAIVYVGDADGHEFDTLEDAQAWCITCVRMS
jgi:hypothetical protein